MAQMITQLGMVFDIAYPDAYKDVLGAFAMINLDIVNISPFECVATFTSGFYTTLLSHTLMPLAAVAGLLLLRHKLRKKGKREIASRCVTAAFYIIFFIYPSVSAKQARAVEHGSRFLSDPPLLHRIFTTFNCVQFDGEFDGSNSWMRVDLTVDCNAPERGGWVAYAVIMSLRAAFEQSRDPRLPPASS